MTTTCSTLTAQCDMGQPLAGTGARLQHRWAAPHQILQAHTAADLRALLGHVQQYAQQGWWCVGGLRYEAAGALNPSLHTHPCEGPLAWFAVYAAPQTAAGDDGLAAVAGAPAAAPVLPPLHWQGSVARTAFDAGVAHIHAGIAAGDYYQINYTQQLHGTAHAAVDGPALFAALQQAQPGGYALYLDMGDTCIASVSPELFFDWHQPASGVGHILTRPMKGTAARGATPALDAAQAQHLQTSVKERAENVMIVDLLRNDLGRLAPAGSVHVPQLFQVQALPTVWQMTSDVQAQLPAGTSLLQLLEALFPCGSVTGAPKRAAMQAIAQLEPEARGWYCGALGVVRPDGAGGVRATFNVPIRTVVLQSGPPAPGTPPPAHPATQPHSAQLRCGIGSGITADATAQAEWQEWQIKQGFVQRVSMDFDVITTMALQGGQWRHGDLHVQRLQQAALHFGFAWDAQAYHLSLQHVADTHPSGDWRVRVALNRQGLFSTQVVPCTPLAPTVYLQLAPAPLPEAHSEFVRFKTSRRAHYERFTPPAHVLDTVLWNAAGEITECTRGNVAALVAGQWITPALSCGLLNGVGRQVALAQGRVVEGVLRTADVPQVQQWAFLNSLRGWLPAQLITTSAR